MDERDEQLPSWTALLHHKGNLAFQSARQAHSSPEAEEIEKQCIT